MNTSTINKLQHTRVGDSINFYVNGVAMDGIVTNISGTYITVLKDNKTKILNIDETFFVKDILIKNKTWNEMNLEERAEVLQIIKAYTPRFLEKTWEQLPREVRGVLKDALDKKPTTGTPQKLTAAKRKEEDMKEYKRTNYRTPANQIEAQGARNRLFYETDDLKDVANIPEGVQSSDPQNNKPLPSGKAPKLKPYEKSGVEQGAYGNVGGRPFIGVSTQLDIDTSKDYEGASHQDFKEQFKHEKQKPKTTMEGHKESKKDGLTSDGVNAVYGKVKEEKKKIEKAVEDTRPTFGIKYLTKAETEAFLKKQKDKI